MPEIRTFYAAMNRADHLISLYDCFRNKRERSVRPEWASKLKKIAHWPAGEKISRIDGKNSMIILRQQSDIPPERFKHDYVSELLRAALVAAVSAMDRYMHDIIVRRILKLIKTSENEMSGELKRLKVPLVKIRHLLTMTPSERKKRSRIGEDIKEILQEELHRSYTFQKADEIGKFGNLMRIKELWGKVSQSLGKNEETVRQKLNEIAIRRNQIVHEADLHRKLRARKDTIREIRRSHIQGDVVFIRTFIEAVHKVLDQIDE